MLNCASQSEVPMFSLLALSQKKIENLVPGIPDDTVKGILKNSLYSWAVSVIVTRGDRAAGAKSALLATLVVVIYAFIVASYKKIFGFTQADEPLSLQREFFVISMGIGIILAQRLKKRIFFNQTVIGTVMPYMLTHQNSSTPLACIICY
jgi:hypothetical protein